MIIYYKCKCASQDRLKISELKRSGHEVRLLSNPTWRREARLYNLKPPFKIVDEKQKIGQPL